MAKKFNSSQPKIENVTRNLEDECRQNDDARFHTIKSKSSNKNQIQKGESFLGNDMKSILEFKEATNMFLN